MKLNFENKIYKLNFRNKSSLMIVSFGFFIGASGGLTSFKNLLVLKFLKFLATPINLADNIVIPKQKKKTTILIYF